MTLEEKIKQLLLIRDRHFKEVHNVTLYPFQRKMSDAMIRSVISNTGSDEYFGVSRQAGKTEGLVGTVEFLMIYLPKITKRPFRTAIFAPQKEQAKTDFDRLKEKLNASMKNGYHEVIDPEESNAVTLALANGSYCYIFPLTATSNPESKTIDMAIYEEANKINDKEKKDKADPMRTSTNAPSFSVGVGGYNLNYFLRNLKNNERANRFTYKDVIAQKRRVYEETGDPWHLRYEQFVTKILNEWGSDDDSFRTQYGLEIITGGGDFISLEQLTALRGQFDYHTTNDMVVFGLDSAKHPDSTVLTIKDIESGKICRWLEIQGDNYENQFHSILSVLRKYPNVVRGAIDSTGQGDFMPDLFENNTDYDIDRVKFSLPSKDAMYKNLLVVIRNKLTEYPGMNKKEREKFEQQMVSLVKEYKGELMSVHHQNDAKAHDDYPDSWALAEWAHKQYLEQGEPDIHII